MDITSSNIFLLPVGNMSRSTECTQFGNEVACIRGTATATLDTNVVDGIGYACTRRSNCTDIQSDCVGTLKTLIRNPMLNLATITDCEIACCYGDDCNTQPIGESIPTSSVAPTNDEATTSSALRINIELLFVFVNVLLAAIVRF
ncbi:uncharacterized protein LOC100181221 [Ciona intestinalis]